jgi:hypothetical protein
LRFEKGPLSDTAQGTASWAASIVTTMDATNNETLIPNDQARTGAERDEVLMTDGRTDVGPIRGLMVGLCVFQSPGLFNGAFIAATAGAMTGMKVAALPGAAAEAQARASTAAQMVPTGPACVGPDVPH